MYHLQNIDLLLTWRQNKCFNLNFHVIVTDFTPQKTIRIDWTPGKFGTEYVLFTHLELSDQFYALILKLKRDDELRNRLVQN